MTELYGTSIINTLSIMGIMERVFLKCKVVTLVQSRFADLYPELKCDRFILHFGELINNAKPC